MSCRRAVSARGARERVESNRQGDHLMSPANDATVVEPHVLGLRCRECGREFPVAPVYTCEWCFGPLEVAYDYDAIARVTSRERIAAGPASLWRYADLLPVASDRSEERRVGK